MSDKPETAKEKERREVKEFSDKHDEWERVSAIDRLKYPLLALKWDKQREVVLKYTRPRPRYIVTAEAIAHWDKLVAAAKEIRIFQMFNELGYHFNYNNAWMDFDGIIHFVNLETMILGDDEEDEGSDYEIKFDINASGSNSNSNSNSKKNRNEFKMEVDGDGSDSDIEIIEASPIASTSSNSSPSKRKREEEVERLPSPVIEDKVPEMSEKKRGKQVRRDTSSGAPASGSASNPARPFKKLDIKSRSLPSANASKAQGSGSSTNLKARRFVSSKQREEMEDEAFIERDKKDRVMHTLPKVKRIPRSELSFHDLAKFQLLDRVTKKPIPLLSLNKKLSNGTWEITKFKIEGIQVVEKGESPRITLRDADFEEKGETRVHATLDPVDFYLYCSNVTYKIVSFASNYSFQEKQAYSEDLSSFQNESIHPILYRSLPIARRSVFKGLNFKKLDEEISKDKKFLEEQFKLEEGIMNSAPIGKGSEGKGFEGQGDNNYRREDKPKITIYKSAQVWRENGKKITLKINDCVSVSPENDPDHPVWFAKIVYFFKTTNAPNAQLQAHLSWFVSPTSTFIGKAAAGRRFLFFSNHCGDVFVSAIIRKVTITRLNLSTNIPPEDGFYYAYTLEEGTRNIVDTSTIEDITTFPQCYQNSWYNCVCCESKKVYNESLKPRYHAKAGALDFNDIKYHINDFVAIKVDNQSGLVFARITSFDKLDKDSTAIFSCSIVIKSDEIVNTEEKDSRRVIITGINRKFYCTALVGKINVMHLEEFSNGVDLERFNNDPNLAWNEYPEIHVAKEELSKDPTFFWTNQEVIEEAGKEIFQLLKSKSKINPGKVHLKTNKKIIKIIKKNELEKCLVCDKEKDKLKEENERIASLKPKETKITAFEPYSGGSMFGYGVSEGCASISTKFACDIHQHAVETTRLNGVSSVHHLATAHVNELIYNGETSVDGIALPQVGEVKIIIGGPPCQGFSTNNLHRFAEDKRCLEPFHLLSSIATLRPFYATMENVRAITTFKLEDDVPLISVLAVMAIDLGYQFCDGILSAESHGGSSKRNRYFILMALRGLEAPSFVEPTHSLADRTHEYGLPARYSSTKDRKITQSLSGRDPKHQLHDFVPAGAIFDDLTNYEFGRPLKEGENANEYDDRSKFKPQKWKKGWDIGYPEGISYASIPKNSLQRSLRLNNRENVVYNHICKGFAYGEKAVILTEIGVKGQLLPNSDRKIAQGNYLDVSRHYRPPLPPGIFEENKDKFYARIEKNMLKAPLRTTLDFQGYFHGPNIHPILNRPVSVLEYARLQGIPDILSLGSTESSIEEKIKIVGNCVPISLGSAIGRSFSQSIRSLQLEVDEDGNASGFKRMKSLVEGYVSEGKVFIQNMKMNGNGKGKGKAKEVVESNNSRINLIDEDDDMNLIEVSQLDQWFE